MSGKDKSKKVIVELDADDLDKVVGGLSGIKSVSQIRRPAEEKSKFSNETISATNSEQAKKGK